MSVFLPVTSFIITRANQNYNIKAKYGSLTNTYIFYLSGEITAETGNHGWVNILPAFDSSFLSRDFYRCRPLLILPPPPLFGKQFWPRKRRFSCGHERLDLPFFATSCHVLYVGNWSASLLSFCILCILPSPTIPDQEIVLYSATTQLLGKNRLSDLTKLQLVVRV